MVFCRTSCQIRTNLLVSAILTFVSMIVVVMLVIFLIRVARAAFMAAMRVANMRMLVEEN